MNDVAGRPAQAGMSCPICHVPLAIGDRQGVEIDYCPQCRGIWLDRGELDKIVERIIASGAAGSAAPAVEPAAPPMWGGHDGRHHDGSHGRHHDDGHHGGGRHGGGHHGRGGHGSGGMFGRLFRH
jgi:Zn-finger nucleic acid-binding protein